MTDGIYIKNNQVSLQILHKTLWCEYVLGVVLYFCIGIPRKTTSSTHYLLSNNGEFL